MIFLKLKRLDFGLHKKFMVFAVVFLVGAAIALTWFLQYRYFINNSGATWDFMWGRPLVFWYSTLLMLLLLVFLTGWTRRPVVAVGIMWALIIVLTYIHINKYNVRGFPLLPEDFALSSEAASLVKFINVGALMRMVIAVILVLFLTFLANRWVAKKFDLSAQRKHKKWWRKWAIASRVLMVVLSAALFLGLTDFVRNHGGQRYEDIDWLNTQLVAWNQVRNYDYNGFILGFLYNMSKFELQEPDNYSEERMAAVLKEYRAKAKKENAKRLDLGKEKINVVMILNESFLDPATVFGGYGLRDFYPYEGGEVLPTWRSVQAKYPHGFMYSTDYGGGTANIEMEALTGLTNYWANTVPYTDLIPRAGELASVASFLKTMGYKTTAIHPFNGSMYKRNIALQHFGYDTFVTELEMKYAEKEGKSEYINDRSAYLQTLDVLNSSGQNQLITLITMQNHLPYNQDIYGGVSDFEITNLDIEEDRRREIEVYYQMLHSSDEYLGEFLAALEQSDKKVVVLFFGDHAAGIFPQTNDNLVKEVRDLTRLMPYFVYTNFEMAGIGHKELPATTPNCLSNTMFNVLGARKPELFYVLDAVCGEVPILANAWFGNEAPTMTRALQEYELITYDLLSGKKYWMK